MKKNVLILLLLTAPLSLFSQTVLMFYNPTYSIVDGKASATFDISLPEEGAYMVYCWIQGVKKSSGGYHSYTLKTVGSGTSSVVIQNSGDWGYSQGSYIFIPYYVTQLRIEGGSMVDVPNVECLAIVSEPMTLGNGYAAMKNHLQHPSSSSGAYASEFHYHDSIGDSSYPPVGFMAHRDKALYYTFQRKEYYLAGQTVTVSVTSSLLSSGSCVVNLFADTEHPTYSWTGNSSLTAQITSSGFYNVMIRGNADGVWGTCDFNINGERYFEDVPVNTSLDVLDDDYLDHNRCCFALCSNGDAASMLLNPVGSVYVYSEDHGLQPSSDFDWGVNPLAIQRMLPGYAHFTTLSNSIPQSNFTAKADVYTGVTYGSSYLFLNPADYPNYKNGDRMISAPASNLYSTTSWAFGDWSVPYYYEGDDLSWSVALEDLDNYAAVYHYTRSGANATNAQVDVYTRHDDNLDADILSLASVKSKGHYYAAGYGWESKLGEHERVFHPRYSLAGGIGGEISLYYKRSVLSGQSDLHPCDLRIVENASFTSEEKSFLDGQIREVEPEVLSEFYERWYQCSNANRYFPVMSLMQYKTWHGYSELLEYCIAHPELLFPVCQLVDEGYGLGIRLLYDMTSATYGDLRKPLSEHKAISKDVGSDKYIIRPPRTSAILYARKVLGAVHRRVISDVTTFSTDSFFQTSYDNTELTLTFELDVAETITIQVYNITNQTLTTILDGEALDIGTHVVPCKISTPGVYVISMNVGGSVYEKKLFLH